MWWCELYQMIHWKYLTENNLVTNLISLLLSWNLNEVLRWQTSTDNKIFSEKQLKRYVSLFLTQILSRTNYFYWAFFIIFEPSAPIHIHFFVILKWMIRIFIKKSFFVFHERNKNNDIFGFNFPTGICTSAYLSTSSRVFVLVSVWEVDCVFRRTHTHTLGVFMLVYETKLCSCAKKVSPDPSHFVSLGANPLPSLLCISIFLSHTHTHPVSVFSNKRDCP